jgi:hypothetical protein
MSSKPLFVKLEPGIREGRPVYYQTLSSDGPNSYLLTSGTHNSVEDAIEVHKGRLKPESAKKIREALAAGQAITLELTEDYEAQVTALRGTWHLAVTSHHLNDVHRSCQQCLD